MRSPLYNPKKWILFLGDLVLILWIIRWTPWIRGWHYNIFDMETGASVFTLFVYFSSLYTFDLYNTERFRSTTRLAVRMLSVMLSAGIFSALLFYSFPQYKFSRSIFLIQLVLNYLALICWRSIFQLFFIRWREKEKIIIIGAGKSGMGLCNALENMNSPYQVIGFLDDNIEKQFSANNMPKVLGTSAQLFEFATKYNIKTAIIAITNNRSNELIHHTLMAKLKGIKIIESPVIFEGLLGLIPVEHINDLWLLHSEGFHMISRKYIFSIKRIIDFWASFLILITTLPLILITILVIRFDSKGSIIFKQKRIGLNGTSFNIFKF